MDLWLIGSSSDTEPLCCLARRSRGSCVTDLRIWIMRLLHLGQSFAWKLSCLLATCVELFYGASAEACFWEACFFCRDAGGVANGLSRLEPKLTPSCPSRGREGGRVNAEVWIRSNIWSRCNSLFSTVSLHRSFLSAAPFNILLNLLLSSCVGSFHQSLNTTLLNPCSSHCFACSGLI